MEADPIEQGRRKLVAQLIQLGFEFNHRSIPAPHGNSIYKMRDSLTYRVSAVVFQVNLLHLFHDDALRVLREDLGNPVILEEQAERSAYIFDNVVFNLMSLCDYLAGTLYYVLHFSSIRNPESALKEVSWRQVVQMVALPNKKATGVSQNRLYNSELGQTIREIDDEHFKGLREYRNDLIHNAAEVPGGELTVELTDPVGTDIRINVPPKFHLYFQPPGGIDDSIFTATEWLVTSVFDHTSRILDELCDLVQSEHNDDMSCLS